MGDAKAQRDVLWLNALRAVGHHFAKIGDVITQCANDTEKLLQSDAPHDAAQAAALDDRRWHDRSVSAGSASTPSRAPQPATSVAKQNATDFTSFRYPPGSQFAQQTTDYTEPGTAGSGAGESDAAGGSSGAAAASTSGAQAGGGGGGNNHNSTHGSGVLASGEMRKRRRSAPAVTDGAVTRAGKPAKRVRVNWSAAENAVFFGTIERFSTSNEPTVLREIVAALGGSRNWVQCKGHFRNLQVVGRIRLTGDEPRRWVVVEGRAKSNAGVGGTGAGAGTGAGNGNGNGNGNVTAATATPAATGKEKGGVHATNAANNASAATAAAVLAATAGMGVAASGLGEKGHHHHHHHAVSDGHDGAKGFGGGDEDLDSDDSGHAVDDAIGGATTGGSGTAGSGDDNDKTGAGDVVDEDEDEDVDVIDGDEDEDEDMDDHDFSPVTSNKQVKSVDANNNISSTSVAVATPAASAVAVTAGGPIAQTSAKRGGGGTPVLDPTMMHSLAATQRSSSGVNVAMGMGMGMNVGAAAAAAATGGDKKAGMGPGADDGSPNAINDENNVSAMDSMGRSAFSSGGGMMTMPLKKQQPQAQGQSSSGGAPGVLPQVRTKDVRDIKRRYMEFRATGAADPAGLAVRK